MSELLSPAGTVKAFYSAISNGADAIYLGLDKFSARAYAENFTLETLPKLVAFAHLRNVRIFVTINTIAYDYELPEIYETIDRLANIGVDAIIVQDLAIFNYIVSNYKSLEAHVSTQMGIDDIEGAKLVKKLGAKRIVFARETPINTIKQIKSQLGIEVETFVHGALCVCYSGNCLMSSMIGDRSGNRGRCAGCCRKLYSLENSETKEIVKTGYLLSMKDLNTSEYIKDLNYIDSFKIEGRMKEPNYVANVTREYRKILDGEKPNKTNLNKVFNRTYTKGFSLGDTSSEITNIEKPNNYGYPIGTVIRKTDSKIWIKLFETLNRGDQVCVESPYQFVEISIPVTKMFDSKGNDVLTESNMAVVYCDKRVNLGAKVFKTKDKESVDKAEESLLNKQYSRLPIDAKIKIEIGKKCFLQLKYQSIIISVSGNEIVEPANKNPINPKNIEVLIGKLTNTPYFLNNIEITMDDNCFVSLKSLNELRRTAIEKLNESRLKRKVIVSQPKEIVPQKFERTNPEITVEVSNDEQFEVVKKLGIKHIYYKNIIRRNNAKYADFDGEILVGGLGGINYYTNKDNIVVSDYSLNVTNAETVALLSSMGVNRITLSEEISLQNINKLIQNYSSKYNTFPNLELMVYGRSKLMHSKYCPLKRLGKCGQCKTQKFNLKDEYDSFPLQFNDDCTINVLNCRTLNIMDKLNDLNGVNYFRLRFTNETPDEVEKIISYFEDVLKDSYTDSIFNKNTQTRGHFLNNPQ